MGKISCIREKISRSIEYAFLNAVTLNISNAISTSKLKYHEGLASKPNDPKTALKIYQTTLKTFINGSKIPLISPIMLDNKLVTDCLNKGNLFNNFFTKHFTPISNDSTVPKRCKF